jgi:CubicO group peptidase (beta-lactamase class C family)
VTVALLLLFIGASTVSWYQNKPQESTPEPSMFSYASPESQGISGESVRELMEAVQGYFDGGRMVGAELLVIKNRRIILHEVVGWSDREKEIPMKKNTLFNIRSMTKPITGTAIQILIAEGRLSLESRASEYLAGFDNEASGNIIIEQLLTHHSGLPLSIITSTDQYETLIKLANETGKMGPQFEPGSKFWYSDAGTEVLGAIIEIETGTSLDVFVSDEILEPLRMNNSFYYTRGSHNDFLRADINPLYVGGIGEWIKIWEPEEPLYPFPFGSQSIYSTPLDYAHFLAMLLDNGTYMGKQVISREAVNRILTPVSKMSTLGSDMPYPEGFYNLEAYYGQMAIIYLDETSENQDVRVIGHSGSDGTWAWAWPENDLMILYFTQSRGGNSGIRLESKIDEIFIHPELREMNNKARGKYSEYLGSYTANFGPFRNAEFVVTVQNGGLALDIPNQLIFELKEPDDEGKWHFKLLGQLSVSFERDETGNVTKLMLYEGEFIYELVKGKPSEVEVYPDDMEKYVGTYETEDPNVTMRVLIANERLALDIPGQPNVLELYPPDEDGRWYIRLNPSIAVSFKQNEAGGIESLNMHLPDGSTITRSRIEETN